MAKSAPLGDNDREDLTAFLDGELDAKSARILEAKMNTNPSIRAEAEAMQRTWELLDYLAKPEPSPTFTSRTLERVSSLRPAAKLDAKPKKPWPGWVHAAGWAAAVLVAGVVGFGGVSLLTRKPPEKNIAREPSEAELDTLLVRDLPVIENRRLYEHAEDIGFVRKLAETDLFGEEGF